MLIWKNPAKTVQEHISYLVQGTNWLIQKVKYALFRAGQALRVPER
jgi:hypothetical protein